MICWLALAAVCMGPGNGRLRGQTVLGSVSGTVSDSTGAVVPGATAALESLDAGIKRSAKTRAAGNYIIPSVPPGRYSLTVTAPGFQSFVVKEFRLLVNESRTIHADLTVGELTQAVTVTGEPPSLNQVNSTISTTVQNTEIMQLPLNGRHFTQLLSLSTGVVMQQSGQQNSFTIQMGSGGISPAINGTRPQMNNFTLDGVDNNARFTNSYGTAPPPDAIQEFKVQSQQNDAQASFSAGGNVNVTTKSGTNEFHGSAWEFLRNDKLSANGYFNNFFGNPRVPYRQNQFGFVLGGPVRIPKIVDGRDTRTYFFTYFERFESRRTRTVTASFPDSAVRGGDFSSLLGARAGADGQGQDVFRSQIYDILSTRTCSTCAAGFVRDAFPGNRIPAARIDPRAKAYVDFFLPLPNRASGFPNHVRTASRSQSSDQFGARADHNFSDNKRLFGRFSYYHTEEADPQTLPTIKFLALNTGVNLVTQYTHVFSPTFLADVQYGYNRTGIPRRTAGYGDDLRRLLGERLTFQIRDGIVPAETAFAQSPFSGILPFSQTDLGNPEYSHQYNVDFKKILTSHQISFGFRYLRWHHVVGRQGSAGMTFSNTGSNQPGFNTSGDGFASFLVGYPSATSISINNSLNTLGDIYVGYAGDSWKVNRKLSLNFGVQYVLSTRPVSKNDDVSIFDYRKAETRPDATSFAFAYVWAGKNPITGEGPNATRALVEGDHNNVAPRVGLAYTLSPKTVIRSGFGMYYDYNTNLVQNSIRIGFGSYPYGGAQRLANENILQPGPRNPAISLANPFVERSAVPPDPAFTIDRRLRDPYTLTWNFGIERLLPGELVFGIAYAATAGKNLVIVQERNTALVGTAPPGPRRPIRTAGPILWRENTGFSTYNSMQVRIEKRYSRGLTFRNSFTWSKFMDLNSDPNTGSIEYLYNRDRSRGPSSFDLPLVNVTSAVFDLPVGRGRKYGASLPALAEGLVGGWQLASIVSLRSGVRYSVVSGVDNGNTGCGFCGGNAVANIVGDPFPAGFRTRAAWFDRQAFQTPAFATLGNGSRNQFRGPWGYNATLSAAKFFRLAERYKLELRGEFFNAFNFTIFGNPVSTLTSPNFGQILGAGGGRDIQLALRFVF
jgi:hypothetical protein